VIKEEIEEYKYIPQGELRSKWKRWALESQSIVLPEREFWPAGRLNSTIVWHPNAPVNSGKDEYVRTANE